MGLDRVARFLRATRRCPPPGRPGSRHEAEPNRLVSADSRDLRRARGVPVRVSLAGPDTSGGTDHRMEGARYKPSVRRWPVFSSRQPEPSLRDDHSPRQLSSLVTAGQVVGFLGPNGAGRLSRCGPLRSHRLDAVTVRGNGVPVGQDERRRFGTCPRSGGCTRPCSWASTKYLGKMHGISAIDHASATTSGRSGRARGPCR